MTKPQRKCDNNEKICTLQVLDLGNHAITLSLYSTSFPLRVGCEIYIYIYTVNGNIFACINVHGFMKMGNFACIKIRVLCEIGSLGYYKSNFRGVHIFADI